jgi:hypothetical protein
VENLKQGTLPREHVGGEIEGTSFFNTRGASVSAGMSRVMS